MTEAQEEQVLKNLYRQVNDAMVNKDIEALEKLLQPDTLLVHMTGYQQPVSEWLEQIESEEMKYYSWQEDHIEVIQYNGKKAQLVGRSRVKARIWGMGPHTWRLQVQMFFEKLNGDWVIVKQVASTY